MMVKNSKTVFLFSQTPFWHFLCEQRPQRTVKGWIGFFPNPLFCAVDYDNTTS